jgi:glycosyltransferase 2 family protein
MNLTFVLKIAFTCLAIGLAASRIDFNLVLDNLSRVNQKLLLCAATFMLLQMLLGALRWWVVIQSIATRLPYSRIFQYFYVSHFFNCFIPGGFVGGDVFRIYFVKTAGLSLLKSTGSVLIDRFVGLISLVSFVLVLTPFIYITIANSPLFYMSLMAASTIVLGIFSFLLVKYLPEIITTIRPLQKFLELKNQLFTFILSKEGYLAFTISIVIYMTQSVLYYFLANSLSIPLTFTQCLLFVAPVTLIVMAFPFSLAGWGIREGAMMMALNTFQVSNEKAFLLAVSFGLLTTLISVPAGLLWLLTPRRDIFKFALPVRDIKFSFVNRKLQTF